MAKLCLPSVSGKAVNGIYLEISDSIEPLQIDGRVEQVLAYAGGSLDCASVLEVFSQYDWVIQANSFPFDENEPFVPFYRCWDNAAIDETVCWVVFEETMMLATNRPEYYVHNPLSDYDFVLIDRERGETIESGDKHSLADGSVVDVTTIEVGLEKRFAAVRPLLEKSGFKIVVFEMADLAEELLDSVSPPKTESLFH